MSGTEVQSPPEKLQPQHDVSKFDCGEHVLNEWLRRRALQNQQSGASSTYVVLDQMRVVGYYSLAAGSVARETVPGRVRRNVSDPVPVVVLGRLAVDRDFHGQGIGRALLRDAILRTLQAADIIGVLAISFMRFPSGRSSSMKIAGFAASPINPLTLMITLAEAINALGKK